MKNLPSFLQRAVLAVAGALALGACNRATYSFNNTAPAYLGAAPVAASRPAAPATAPVAAPAAATAATPAPRLATAAPVAATPAPATAATAPVAAAPAAGGEVVAATTAPAKPSLAQRLVLKKLTKKLDKLASQAPQLKKRDAAASTGRADGGLRQALVLGVIGLGIILLGALLNVGIIYVIGVIVIIIALVLLLLYLINQV